MNVFIYIKKLLRIFDKSFLSAFPLILLFLFATFTDLLSIALIAPYISFLLNPEGQSFFQEFLRSLFQNYSFNEIFVIFSLILFLVFVLKFIFALSVRFAIKRFALRCRHQLQINLLKSYQSMNYSDFSLRGSSDFIKNVRELSGDCISTLDSSLRIISEGIVFVAVILYLFWIQPFVVLSLLCVILLVTLVHNFTLKKKTVLYGRNRTEALSHIYQAVDEGLKGFKEVKILAKENYFKQLQKLGLDKVYENELKSELILFYPRYLYELIIVIFLISFVFFKINYGMASLEIIPLIGTFSVASLRIIPSISIISSGIIMIQYTNFAIDIIYKDIISLNISKKKLKDHSVNYADDEIKTIQLQNIKFKYPNSKDLVFDGLNLNIKKNECIGIIGENGSGKSTLIDILLGLLKIDSGRILLNDIEQKNANKITQKMGYIPQDHLIISDIIKKNITLENNEKFINQVKLQKAIRSANLKKLIDVLPQGIETLIGKDGVRLSGGEYKKIALARLFYHDRDFLILDEATNSLDRDSEEIIINELKRIKKEKTIIIISHSSKTLNACDVLYEIKDKRIELYNN